MAQGFLHEFKAFITKGNVLDLAIGVIIGGAFGKIVTSVVNDLLMPLIAYFSGGINFTEMKLILRPATLDAAKHTVEAVTLNYGSFIQSGVDFLIIAFCVFLIVKAVSKVRQDTPEKTLTEVDLLTDIRDLLKQAN